MIRAIVIFLSLSVGWANDEYQRNELEALLQDMSSSLPDQEPYFDFENEEDASELQKIFSDRGFGADKLMKDFGSLKGIPGIFKNGDEKRWTTLNFAYQLACYQGVGGPFFAQALWAMSKYNKYGCYCGGGVYKGNYLDATDKCCQAHDHCYVRVMAKYKLTLGCHTYTVPYSVSCCEDQKYTKCTDSGPSAGRELCECDQVMSRCVAEHATSYNENLLSDRSKCRGSFTTKPLSVWEVVKSCKHAFKPIVKLHTTYKSQGTCPNKKGRLWWDSR